MLVQTRARVRSSLRVRKCLTYSSTKLSKIPIYMYGSMTMKGFMDREKSRELYFIYTAVQIDTHL